MVDRTYEDLAAEATETIFTLSLNEKETEEYLAKFMREIFEEGQTVPRIINNKRVEMPRCQATTKKGTQCLNSAWRVGYCGLHGG